MTALEIGTVLGRMLHMLHDGMQGRPFYDASRSELLKHTSTAAKVRHVLGAVCQCLSEHTQGAMLATAVGCTIIMHRC